MHYVSGIRVQCHQTRSRESNRSLARRILRDKGELCRKHLIIVSSSSVEDDLSWLAVDLHLHPGSSKIEAKRAKEAAKKAAKDRKRRRKISEKVVFGELGESAELAAPSDEKT